MTNNEFFVAGHKSRAFCGWWNRCLLCVFALLGFVFTFLTGNAATGPAKVMVFGEEKIAGERTIKVDVIKKLTGEQATPYGRSSLRFVTRSSQEVNVTLCDTAAQERYESMLKRYSDGATAVVYVLTKDGENYINYDLDFAGRLGKAKEKLAKVVPNGQPVIIVVQDDGYESDSEVREAVSATFGDDTAVVLVDINTGQGIDALKETIGETVITARQQAATQQRAAPIKRR